MTVRMKLAVKVVMKRMHEHSSARSDQKYSLFRLLSEKIVLMLFKVVNQESCILFSINRSFHRREAHQKGLTNTDKTRAYR